MNRILSRDKWPRCQHREEQRRHPKVVDRGPHIGFPVASQPKVVDAILDGNFRNLCRSGAIANAEPVKDVLERRVREVLGQVPNSGCFESANVASTKA